MGSGSACSRSERQLGPNRFLENTMTQQIVPSGNSAIPFPSSSGAVSTALDEIFSYEDLPADHADALRKQAARIRDRMTAATEIMIKAVVETGRDLIAVKQHLEHGKFCDWVHAECGFSRRTAENYMRVACAFSETKCETISHLQLSTLYELSAKSTPPELVSLVTKCAGADQPISDDEVREMLAEARFRKLEAKRQEERADAAHRLSKCVREKREAQKRAWEEEQRKTEARALAAALSIIDKLGPEGLRIVAPAFEGPDAYLVAQHLRAEIENSTSKANPAQEAT
jgi:Protein of unknown function (DUF3102)